MQKKAVIKSAASAASARGGCASSRLDHGLKFYGIQGGCASSRLVNNFLDSKFVVLVFLDVLLCFQPNWVAVNKSAASAASLDGFSSRDQVGC